LKIHRHTTYTLEQFEKKIIIEAVEEVLKTETDGARGGDEVGRMTRRLGLSEFESSVDTRTRNDSINLINTLNVLPTITSDCGRGVSDMNLAITVVSVNGRPVEDFSPQPYVKVWLRIRGSAVSAPRGKQRNETE